MPTNNKKPTNKKSSTKGKIVRVNVSRKAPTNLDDLRVKLTEFLENGAGWSTKHFGVSERIKVQILPENKSGTNPKRLAIFETLQGKTGRKGLRISSKQTYLDVISDLSDDKTLEIVNIIDKLNPTSVPVNTEL